MPRTILSGPETCRISLQVKSLLLCSDRSKICTSLVGRLEQCSVTVPLQDSESATLGRWPRHQWPTPVWSALCWAVGLFISLSWGEKAFAIRPFKSLTTWLTFGARSPNYIRPLVCPPAPAPPARARSVRPSVRTLFFLLLRTKSEITRFCHAVAAAASASSHPSPRYPSIAIDFGDLEERYVEGREFSLSRRPA